MGKNISVLKSSSSCWAESITNPFVSNQMRKLAGLSTVSSIPLISKHLKLLSLPNNEHASHRGHLYAVGRGSIPERFIKTTWKWYTLLSCMAFSTVGKSMGVKITVILDGRLLTVEFTVRAQLCVLKAEETGMGASLITKNGNGRNFDCF